MTGPPGSEVTLRFLRIGSGTRSMFDVSYPPLLSFPNLSSLSFPLHTLPSFFLRPSFNPFVRRLYTALLMLVCFQLSFIRPDTKLYLTNTCQNKSQLTLERASTLEGTYKGSTLDAP